MAAASEQPVRRRGFFRRHWLVLLFLLLFLAGAVVVAYEMIASPFQAMFLAGYGKRLTYRLEAGESPSIRFPQTGPYDQRLGHVGLPAFSARLAAAGFEITQQARLSPEMAQLFEHGLYLPYREKTQAGLSLLDCRGDSHYQQRFPREVYADFTSVPPLVANTLLYIENRELLDPNHPQRNPAVEWDRLAQAVLEKIMQSFHPERNVPGGSTLATQIEKYRHSPDGLTLTPQDKLIQMASASVRAYLDGSDTRATRRRLVLDYLNTVPLAAAPGFGEVHGLGDGLAAWFGADFQQVNGLLRRAEANPETARAYKQVLALLIAQRKPSGLLLGERRALAELADAHLRLLAGAGVISPALRDLALRERIDFRTADRPAGREGRVAFAANKATNAIRLEISQLLGVSRLYDLDRLDLTARTTLHMPTQRAVADLLASLDDPLVVEASGLYGDKLLAPENDLSRVIYGFTLYELSDNGALLRVQADNFDQPFDINQGAKLDMGSSAKLRTLITYLELVSELHRQYAALDARSLARVPVGERDVLGRWAVDWLRQHPGGDLAGMLAAAMDRTYSANPQEAFFTGGGLHSFANFNREDDGRSMDLWEATRNSVNLPFIRLMRDMVRHLIYRAPSTALQVLADVQDPRRHDYLRKFADKEGQEFLARFHKKYRGLKPEEATAALLNHLTANPRRLAAVYRYLEPRANRAAFAAFLKSRLANPEAYDDGAISQLYDTYGPERFNLSERGYITQIHPLELWLVAYLRAHPQAGWREIVEASGRERVEVYDWLYKAGRKNAQDSRIQSLMELEAFQEIHRRWRRLGYPFSSLVPSYASAIGSSADRPAALAELMGVILNDGVKQLPARVNALEFAAGTPYHTVFQRRQPEGMRVFPAEVARTIRQALLNVVRDGTARRVKDAFPSSVGQMLVGGKTGTGDQRYETFSPSGQLLNSRVVNRVATFAFFIGSRFYGVVTAFVPGEAAADYHFTSGLPVQILKTLAPALRPLLLAPDREGPSWEEAVAAFDAENPPRVPPAAPAAPATSAPPPAAPAAAKPGKVRPAVPTPAPPAAVPSAPSPVPVPAPLPPPKHPPLPPPRPEEPPPVHHPPPARPGEGFNFI